MAASSGSELILLGTSGGPPPSAERTGIASALVIDGAVYLIDCGRSSFTQYIRAGLRLDRLRAIFLTHLHVDHLADYYNFFLLGAVAPNRLNDMLTSAVGVYGPGPAGALPSTFGGGESPTINPSSPTPGIADLTRHCHNAYAYGSNVFMRHTGVRDIRTFMSVNEITLPTVGANASGLTAPEMDPFLVMEDDRVRVTAILVPHGPVFPSFAFRFDTSHGSVTFSGDTTYTPNIPRIAQNTDVLVHEAMSMEGSGGLQISPALASHIRDSHVDVQSVGPIAQAAQAKHLVLSHISDMTTDVIDVNKWQLAAQDGYDGLVTVGSDLDRFRMSAVT